MRRNRKNSIKKERIIMIASSAFVLTALTLTGVYMKEGSVESKDNGYKVDFGEVGKNNAGTTEIAQNPAANRPQNTTQMNEADGNLINDIQVTEDDLDYMPMEAGSNLVEIPGLTDEGVDLLFEENIMPPEGENGEQSTEEDAENVSAVTDTETSEEEHKEETSSEKVVVDKELSFGENSRLIRPVSGAVLLPYSMNGSIYFATLDLYKYNPAVVFSAEQGTSVAACAEGKVSKIFEDSEIGHAVTLELGNGYEATYGQLKDISVTPGSYVNPGDAIANVAAATKYYSVEGDNLYFQLTKDGVPVNPENLF